MDVADHVDVFLLETIEFEELKNFKFCIVLLLMMRNVSDRKSKEMKREVTETMKVSYVA
jgi:hypothetical protein